MTVKGFFKVLIKGAVCLHQNKVDTKPQAQSNFDVTSFRRKQISKNFIMGTYHRTDQPTDQLTDRPSDGRTKRVIEVLLHA